MTKMVRVKIENSDKKSVYEINHWALNKSNCDGWDDDETQLAENTKLEDGYQEEGEEPKESTWIQMTEEIGWRWGDVEIIMEKEEYEEYDWNDNDEFLASDYEMELGSMTDGCWTEIEFMNLHEDNESDEDELYDLIRDYGDVEDYECWFHGPITHEVTEEWDED